MAKKQPSVLATLRKYLAHSPQPVLLIGPHRVIEYCNAACCQWLATPEVQLVGRAVPYHLEATRASAPATGVVLAPPPEVYAGTTVRRRIQPLGADPTAARWATFLPLQDQEGTGVLVVVGEQEVGTAAIEPERLPEAARLHAELAAFRQRLAEFYSLHTLIGNEPSIERVRAQVEAAATSRSRVLVVGPRGSGREQVARTIYYHQSPDAQTALVPLSCGLLDAELLQTTITAYIQTQPELEVTGPLSLLLLDVDELKPDAQRSLMGVLSILELKAHTLATARRPVLELARNGEFRPDLAHFLSTLVIELPSLQERSQDIPLLAQKFVEFCNAEGPRQLSGFHEDALDRLVQHTWPRNVDELQQVVREAHRRAAGPWIQKADLPPSLGVIEQALKHPPRPLQPIQLDAALAQFEREILEQALEVAKGNRARAAELVGLSRQRFVRRLAQLGITTDERSDDA